MFKENKFLLVSCVWCTMLIMLIGIILLISPDQKNRYELELKANRLQAELQQCNKTNKMLAKTINKANKI